MRNTQKDALLIFSSCKLSVKQARKGYTKLCLTNHKTHDMNKQKLHTRTSRTAFYSDVLHPHEPNEVIRGRNRHH